jgi:hypothetical protein
MKIYRVQWTDHDGDTHCEWSVAKDKAKRRANEIRDDNACQGVPDVSPFEFPHRRAEIVEWLNKQFSNV